MGKERTYGATEIEVTEAEVAEMVGPTVSVEPGERSWRRHLDEQITVQLDAQTAGIVRIMKVNQGRSVGDILRDAIAGRGLRAVDGYTLARQQYSDGRRVAKAPAAGGRTRIGDDES